MKYVTFPFERVLDRILNFSFPANLVFVFQKIDHNKLPYVLPGTGTELPKTNRNFVSHVQEEGNSQISKSNLNPIKFTI